MHAAASDPRLDVSLRFLSLLVSGAIALSLLWFLYVLVEPWIDLRHLNGVTPIVEPDPLATQSARYDELGEEVGPPSWAARLDAPLSSAKAHLIAPAFTVFRCELRGRVTYADQPCDRGGMRVLRLPRN
jgi:hypothetical protein